MTFQETVRKWEVGVLFDGTQPEAEALLESIAELVLGINPTSSCGLALIRDLAAWEKCRCANGGNPYAWENAEVERA